MKMKKTVSWILSLMLVFTMIPALGSVAYAEDGTDSPAISISSGDIEKGDKVYMGVRNINGSIVPISWLVLGGANSTNLKDGDVPVDSRDTRLLITEQTQGVTRFDSSGSSNAWQGSTAQTWCSEFLTGSDSDTDRFTAAEEAVPLFTTKNDGQYGDWGVSSLANERVFFLSAEEVSGNYGYFNSDASRVTYHYNDEQTAYNWWLRSPDSYNSNNAARVTPGGDVANHGVDDGLGARPAFNFNLKSALFISAAVGGKSTGAVGADALKKISTTSTNEWKLTLHDSSRDVVQYSARTDAVLSATEGYDSWSVSIIGKSDEQATLPMPKENEYVSAILTDSNDKALYYGNIANSNMIGWGTVSIPKGLAAGEYKLHIFSEEINDDKFTDYASAFSTIDLTVDAPPAETFTVTFKAAGGIWTDGTTTDKEVTVEKGSAATAPADPTREGFTFDGWDTDYSNVTSNLTVTAKWKENTTPPTPSEPVSIKDAKVVLSKTAFTYNAKVQKPTIRTIKGLTLKEGTDYTAAWSNASSKNVGTYTVTITGKGDYTGTTKATYKINKAANPLTIKPKTATVKYSKLKKKAQTLAVTKVIKFTKDVGDKKTYTLSSAKKGKKSFKKYFKINKTTSKVTIKKNKKMKKGTYKVKVKVKALGNNNYKASAWKTVTFTVKVK